MSDQEYRSGVVRKFMTGSVSHYLIPFKSYPIAHRTDEEMEAARVRALHIEATMRPYHQAIEAERSASAKMWGE